jgi:hypothetical protein
LRNRVERVRISPTWKTGHSPAQRMGARKAVISGEPISKKLENLEHNVALCFMHYNFCRIHQTLRVTPAMEVALAGQVWTVEEIVRLGDDEHESQ